MLMSVRSVSFRIDEDLDQQLRSYAADNGLTQSQAARELLRQALGYADPVDRGWREGFNAAYAQTMRELAGAG
jgi:antitoxin component of RelBE/YafQ-DinJ toxin-antitoxin module